MNYSFARRDTDFMAAFSRMAAEWKGPEPPTVDDIIRRVVAGGAPSFYLSYERASRVASDIIAGRVRPGKSLRWRKWADFAGLVRARLADNPGMSIGLAVMLTAEQAEAPSFYLTFHTARRLYFRLREKRLATRAHRIGRRRLL